MSTENQRKRKRGGCSHEASHGELNAAAVSPSLPELVRDHLGRQLQAVYGSLTVEQQPQRLLDLIAQLDVALGQQDSEAASVFRQELLAALPGLRSFAMSLVVNATRADDLVQETLLKAWKSQDRFEPGSNLMAWLCTIMRNQFYTECRKRRREVEDADGAAAAQLIALPSQEHGIELQMVWAILTKLPPAQREALLLVAGQGMTYEAAAALLGTQTGTMKSRVSRARAFLADALGIADERQREPFVLQASSPSSMAKGRRVRVREDLEVDQGAPVLPEGIVAHSPITAEVGRLGIAAAQPEPDKS